MLRLFLSLLLVLVIVLVHWEAKDVTMYLVCSTTHLVVL